MWNDLTQDVRYAFRSIRQHAGFFVTAVLIIGLGVGGSTAIFSVVNPMLLRSLPFEDPDRLVWIANTGTSGLSAQTSRTSNLRDYRRLNESFEQMTGYFAFFDYNGYNLTGDGEPERLVGVPVAQDFLDVLGVRPLIGRNFVEEEGVWNGPSTAILTHGFWQRRYAGDPQIVGQTITINDNPTAVVGVLPPTFDFATYFTPGSTIDFLEPFPIADETDNWGNTLVMVGRLHAGRTIEDAQAALDLINRQLSEADPNRWGLGAVVTDLQEKITGRFRGAMLLLAAASGLVMVIVCANLSNLLLARAAARRQEIAIRAAMGASRTRLVRQLLTESLVLSGSGAAFGIFLAYAITRVVAGASAINVPLLHSVTIDGAALGFTLVLAFIAGVVFGIVPALQLSMGHEQAALTDATRGSSEGRRGAWIRESLVVSEVALACMLLIGGGLLLRSFVTLLDVDLGFQSEDAMAWRIDTTRTFETREERPPFFERLVDEVEAVPGVESAGLTDTLPLGRNRSWGLRVKGVVYSEDQPNPGAFPRMVDFGYLETMRIPLVSGRYFAKTDTAETEPVIIINERMARAVFPESEALGQVILSNGLEWRIIGVVADVRHSSLEQGAFNEMYMPITQQRDWGSLELVVRSGLPPESLVGGVRAALRSIDTDMPTTDFQTLGDIVDRSVSPRRFTLMLIEAFAATALVLASLGIYGVLSYTVSRRTQEMGIRMALGASGAQLKRQVVLRTLVLAGVGIVIGWVGAFSLSRLMESLLYGVGPTDPSTFLTVTVLLVVIAGLAGYAPARRAAKIDPMSVLTS